ncbi:hypothetical protein [Paenibacillus agricola]|uniref:Uncharacterized protein n=1 Tax=Paenibacillus agricola TaxID=2716264 RepID=A0ABX0J6K3_9BACL|nr:hypothetical protein [Paenibacillus agricola]NHN31006.1 hypothetical protein [Paenibacillus agricola]
MKKKTNKAVTGLLLLSLTMGLAGSAAAADDQTDSVPKADQTMTVPTTMKVSLGTSTLGGVFMAHPAGFGLLGNPVHERNYLKMLVKAYAPDSEQAWSNAFTERKQAAEQFSKTITIRTYPALPSGEATSSEATQIIAAKPVDGEFAVKEIQAGDQKAHVTFINKEHATLKISQNNPVGSPLQDGIINEMSAMAKETSTSPQAKLQGDFSKAVDAGDAASIKELLPALLEDYKQTTDNMNKSIEQQKQFQAEHGEGAISTPATPAVEPTK